MDTEKFNDAKDRYTKLLPVIANLKDRIARRDLIKFTNISVKLLDKISKEEVRCRQTKKVTETYKRLVQEYIDSVDVLEKYAVYAVLAGG